MWVADGFDLTDRRAQDMLQNALPYARSGEVRARVVQAPDADKVAQAQGYASSAVRDLARGRSRK